MLLVFFSLCFPQRDMFVMDNLHAAFEVDSLNSSHPLNRPEEDVETMLEINEMLDAISYRKVGRQLMINDQSFCRLFLIYVIV